VVPTLTMSCKCQKAKNVESSGLLKDPCPPRQVLQRRATCLLPCLCRFELPQQKGPELLHELYGKVDVIQLMAAYTSPCKEEGGSAGASIVLGCYSSNLLASGML
jgi:hypothetical protein